LLASLTNCGYNFGFPMAYEGEALRAHFKYTGGYPSDIYVASNMGDAGDQGVGRLAAEVSVVRRGRGIEPERELWQITDMLAENTAYVANAFPEIWLSGVLGYCLMGAPTTETPIRIQEAAVRSIGVGRPHPEQVQTIHHLDQAAYRRVLSSMVRVALEDYAPEPGNMASLQGVPCVITDAPNSGVGSVGLVRYGFEPLEGGYIGDAAAVYTAMGGSGALPK